MACRPGASQRVARLIMEMFLPLGAKKRYICFLWAPWAHKIAPYVGIAMTEPEIIDHKPAQTTWHIFDLLLYRSPARSSNSI
jgi:hypothetical protein